MLGSIHDYREISWFPERFPYYIIDRHTFPVVEQVTALDSPPPLITPNRGTPIWQLITVTYQLIIQADILLPFTYQPGGLCQLQLAAQQAAITLLSIYKAKSGVMAPF